MRLRLNSSLGGATVGRDVKEDFSTGRYAIPNEYNVHAVRAALEGTAKNGSLVTVGGPSLAAGFGVGRARVKYLDAAASKQLLAILKLLPLAKETKVLFTYNHDSRPPEFH